MRTSDRTKACNQCRVLAASQQRNLGEFGALLPTWARDCARCIERVAPGSGRQVTFTPMHLKIPGASAPVRRPSMDVLSMSKLAAGQQRYYLDAVARGVEDYYTDSGEAPGEWIGTASADLGLSGHVADSDLHAVLSGTDPRTLAALGRANQRVPGFDLTFSAPKSVSLVWALSADADVAASVVAAHDGAVRAALEWLEAEACFGRRGRNGLTLMRGSGLVAAAFRHRTSRAGDPQLHTHALVANLVRGEDGRWSALDARQLYARVKTAGALYRAELRDQLTRSLGVSWTAPTQGVAEIEGIPRPVVRAFSQRRAEIEAALAERGLGGAKAAQVAALDTRRAKSYAVDSTSLAAEWMGRAERAGFGPERVAAVLLAPAKPQSRDLTTEEVARRLVASDSSFSKGAVLQLLAGEARDGASITELERRADAFLRSSEVVELAGQPTGRRYTTRVQLALEAHVLDVAVAARDLGAAVVAEPIVSESVRGRGLSREQEVMVRRLTTSGAGVEVVVGVAGSGKTTALAAAHHAWTSAGVPVVGTALSARAAAELEAGSGIPSTTLASFLVALEGPTTRLPAGGVVVVDEAGMVGTRDLARVLDVAHRDRAKVVLVGDHRQLPEIAAGGAFAALAHRLDAITLNENRRQADRRHRRALRHLRHGNPARALADLRARGQVVTTDTRPQLVEQLIADWHGARQAGGDVLILAARRSTVRELNDAARAHLRTQASLGDDLLVVDGIGFAAGDRVIALRNDRRIGVRNGDRGVITAIHTPTTGASRRDVSAAVTVRLDSDRTVRLSREYVEAGHLDHGYASTIHTAQGATVDHALVVADHALAREGAYVALSRGRQTNRLYATTTDLADDLTLEASHGGRRTWSLLARLQRRAEKQLALDHPPLIDRSIR